MVPARPKRGVDEPVRYAGVPGLHDLKGDALLW